MSSGGQSPAGPDWHGATVQEGIRRERRRQTRCRLRSDSAPSWAGQRLEDAPPFQGPTGDNRLFKRSVQPPFDAVGTPCSAWHSEQGGPLAKVTRSRERAGVTSDWTSTKDEARGWVIGRRLRLP